MEEGPWDDYAPSEPVSESPPWEQDWSGQVEPAQSAAPAGEPAPWEQNWSPQVEAESAPDTFWREARHSIIPALGSLPAMGAGAAGGATIGALGGPFAPVTVPVGGIVGGAAGALGGGYIISSLQEWALKKLGLDDSEQRAANEEAHPYAGFAGQLAPNVIAFSPGKLTEKISTRLLGGALMGGLEAGQELAHTGEVDPYKAAGAAAFGAVFAKPTRVGRAGMAMGERFVPGASQDVPVQSRVPGRPDLVDPPPDAAAQGREATTSQPAKTGLADEPVPPPQELDTVGNPHTEPARSAREYPKDNEPVALTPEEPAIRPRDMGDDVRLALNPDEYPQAAGQGIETGQPSVPRARITPRQRLNPDEYPQEAPGARARAREQALEPAQELVQEEVRPQVPKDELIPAPDQPPIKTGLEEVAQARGQSIDPAQFADAAREHARVTGTDAPVTAAVTRLTRPKVVDRAIERARAEGHDKIAKALEMVEPTEAMQVATKYLRAVENQGGTIKNTGQAGKPADYATARIPSKAATVEELGVTARSKADAERKGGAIRALRQAFEEFPPTHGDNTNRVPTSKAEIAALKERLTKALAKATGSYGGKDPLSYRPRVRPAEWLWARAAKRLIEGRMTPKQINEFVALEKQLRSGNPEDVANVRATGRIEGDIARSRRSGEEAVLSAETEQARAFPGERVSPEDVAGIKRPVRSSDEVELLAESPQQEQRLHELTPDDQLAKELYPDLEHKLSSDPTMTPEELAVAEGSRLIRAGEDTRTAGEHGAERADSTPEAEADLTPAQIRQRLAAQKKTPKGEAEVPAWKQAQEQQAAERVANMARLRELRAKGTKAPSATHVLTAFLGDDTAAVGGAKNARRVQGEFESVEDLQRAVSPNMYSENATRAPAFIEWFGKKQRKGRSMDQLAQLAADESGAGRVPQWMSGMFGQQSTQATQQAATNLLKQVKPDRTLGIWSTDTLVRRSDAFWGGIKKNPMRDYLEALQKGEVRQRDLIEADGTQIVDPMGVAMERHAGKVWDDFQRLIFDQTHFQVFANRPATTADQGFPLSAKARDIHPRLEAEYNALPADLKAIHDNWEAFTNQRQADTAQARGVNRLAEFAQIKDDAFVNRVINETETAADISKYGPEIIEMLRKSGNIATLKGPYTPQRRWGSWVVQAEYDIQTPATALRSRKPGSWEFGSKADADAFEVSLDAPVETRRSYHVDAQGNDHYIANGKEFKYTKDDAVTDPTIVQRWEVGVQKYYLEFTDLYRQALARHAELRDSGAYKPSSLDVQPKAFAPASQAEALAENLGMNSLRGNKHYQNLTPSQQELLRKAMAEEHLQALASSRGGSTRAHRSNIPGYEQDFIRAASAYVQETGQKLALLEHRPQMDTALRAAKDSVEAGVNPEFSAIRRSIINEIEKRHESILNDNFNMHASVAGRAIHRVLAVSNVARLGSPGYSIRNLTQAPLLGAPAIHGYYGEAGVTELARNFKQMSVPSTIKAGLKNTGRAFMGREPVKLIDDIRAAYPDAFSRQVIDHLRETGAIDGEAGFMVQKYAAGSGDIQLDLKLREYHTAVRGAEKALTAADRALQWADQVSRQLPAAVEMVNRVPIGVTVAKMEFAKNGGDMKAALRKAVDVVDQTQFRYSDSNKPVIQKNLALRLPLQFKEFGKGTYSLIGRNIGKVIHNMEPGDRAAGAKTLAGVAVATTAFAGIMGLPTEPFRMLLLGAKAAGLTDKDWDEAELWVRKMTHAIAGKAGGEALAKGLPRLLNIDLSSGIGMDNLIFFGSPRSGTDRDFDNNLYSWVGQMMIGAPGTLIGQSLRGLRQMANGNYMKGAQDLIPIKVAADTARAVRQYREGALAPNARELSKPYSVTEAASRAAGLPPGREAEEQFHSRVNREHDFSERDRRGRLINAWMSATTPADKQKAFQQAIQGGVNGRDLVTSYRQRMSQERREVGNTVPTRRNKPFAEQSRDVLNIPNERRERTPRLNFEKGGPVPSTKEGTRGFGSPAFQALLKRNTQQAFPRTMTYIHGAKKNAPEL